MLLYRLVELQYPALVEQRWYFGETGLYPAREIGIAPKFCNCREFETKDLPLATGLERALFLTYSPFSVNHLNGGS